MSDGTPMGSGAPGARVDRLLRAGLPDLSTPVARLRHVVDVFDVQGGDDKFLVTATSNLYGDGVKTGLTWGDLAEILALVDPDAGEEDEPGSDAWHGGVGPEGFESL